jgi:hypothetical protein
MFSLPYDKLTALTPYTYGFHMLFTAIAHISSINPLIIVMTRLGVSWNVETKLRSALHWDVT